MIRRRRDRLIVFTRYPVPGTVKTRLIPAVGAQGAAEIQRRMTGHTLERVRRFLRDETAGVEVRWDGGDRARIRTWLGEDLLYAPQGGGDLGERMDRAFRDAFGSGVLRAVLIGTDCPEMSPEILGQAFRSLRRNDAVLGPARDGGYYLIGLRKPEPELFREMAWGSDQVFARTREIARARGLRVALLGPLADVDRPEDLPAWEETVRRSGSWGDGGFRLSIVLPTLDEAGKVIGALESTRGGPRVVERIVADGGSRDDTVPRAVAWGAPGRSPLHAGGPFR